MTNEDVISQILMRQPKVTREQILEKLTSAREKTGSLISDETLLRMIAAEFDVEITINNVDHDHKLPISHIVSGLNDVTVTGRVVAVYPVKAFEGKKPGKLTSLTAVDNDGAIRVILWNEKADVVETGALKAGQVVRFSHGYSKEDRDGKVELHLNTKSEITIDPSSAASENYPLSIGKFASKIKEITTENKTVNLKGTIQQVFLLSTFTRQDGTEGSVIRFMLADDTGEVQIVVWNEKALELEKSLTKNSQVQLINGRVKTSSNGNVEVHVDASTYLEVEASQKPFTKISCLENGSGLVNVEGEVASVPVSREVKTNQSEAIKLSVFDLKDETGIVRVSAWRNHAETVGSLLMGTKIVLENVYSKTGYDGVLELSTRAATVVLVI